MLLGVTKASLQGAVARAAKTHDVTGKSSLISGFSRRLSEKKYYVVASSSE
jgi:hypothetical protein